MKTEWTCCVILARNLKRLSAWYAQALFLKPFRSSLKTVDLRNRFGLRILIADAKTFASGPVRRRTSKTNTVLLHIKAPDVAKYLQHVGRRGGKILFGPSTDTDRGRTYRYGGFADPEGNVIWVAEL